MAGELQEHQGSAIPPVLRERARPVSRHDEQRLAAVPALAEVLPGGGLRRGSVVGVAGPGSASLIWSLLAPVTGGGGWAALVGLPSAGLLAAAHAGVALERLAVVASPGAAWATVLGALLDGFDLVVTTPPRRVRPADARRLQARARERSTVVVLAGAQGVGAWPEGPDLHLGLSRPAWEGLGRGHGHLRRRRVHLEVGGRREAARPRSVDLWLPAPDAAVALVEPTLAVLATDPPPAEEGLEATTVPSVRVAS